MCFLSKAFSLVETAHQIRRLKCGSGGTKIQADVSGCGSRQSEVGSVVMDRRDPGKEGQPSSPGGGWANV